MITSAIRAEVDAPYVGVRMTADEFLEIPDDGLFYELIDGVVVVSPSPSPRHQRVAIVVLTQLVRFLERAPIGQAFMELDVHLAQRPVGGDLVYRPEVIFVPTEQLRRSEDRIVGAPPLVVEVISRGSHRIDTRTKRHDYERFGVQEYWLIDPQREALLFLVNENGAFVEADTTGDAYESRAVPGFVLDLAAVRAAFHPW